MNKEAVSALIATKGPIALGGVAAAVILWLAARLLRSKGSKAPESGMPASGQNDPALSGGRPGRVRRVQTADRLIWDVKDGQKIAGPFCHKKIGKFKHCEGKLELGKDGYTGQGSWKCPLCGACGTYRS